MKKIIILLVLLFLSFGNVTYGNGASSSTPPPATEKKADTTQKTTDKTPKTDAPYEFTGDNTDLNSPNFEIETSLFTFDYDGVKGGDTKETINNLLGRIIQKMMIVLGSLSFVLMIIGGGILILSGGDDSQLKRGKKTFNYSIIGLIVALSSYYLVNLIGYILYNGK